MGTFKEIAGVNNSAIHLIKRQDTGGYANPLAIVNKDGAHLETQDHLGALAPLHSATPSGGLVPNNAAQVATRSWVDGHVTNILFEVDLSMVNTLVGTGGNAYDSVAHRGSGIPFAGTFTSTYTIPQNSWVYETFFWTDAAWNGSPGAPGGPPPTLSGVYFSMGDVDSGGTSPYAAGFDRFGAYLKGDPVSPKTFQELKYMDKVVGAGGVQVRLNVHIPVPTANPLTIGAAAILIKVINNPR